MIYISDQFHLDNYKCYSLYGDNILFFKDPTNYIQSNFNNTKYSYAIYYLNSQQFVEFDNEYLPYEFISMSHLDNFTLDPVPNSDPTVYNLDPTYSTIYLSNDFSQFTNDLYYSPFFSLIFITGFLLLVIITLIINGLTRLIFKGGILFHN